MSHGGAWGSGWPWMYRLTASPFFWRRNIVLPFIGGYRTLPGCHCRQTSGGLTEMPCWKAKKKGLYPSIPITQSWDILSGAHVAVLGEY
jgi:hypothetical protein